MHTRPLNKLVAPRRGVRVFLLGGEKKSERARERERRGDKGAFRPPPLPPFSVNPARITRVEIPVRAWLFNLDFSTLCFCFRKKRGREKERENWSCFSLRHGGRERDKISLILVNFFIKKNSSLSLYWNRIQFWKQRCSIIEFWIYFNRQNLKNLSIFRFPLAISSRSRYSKKIFYFETTFLSTLPLLSSRKACFQSRNIRLARLIGLTRWAISPETPPSDAVCPPLPLPRPREEGKRNIFARDRCTRRTFIRMAVVVSRHDGGRRRISGSVVPPPPSPQPRSRFTSQEITRPSVL